MRTHYAAAAFAAQMRVGRAPEVPGRAESTASPARSGCRASTGDTSGPRAAPSTRGWRTAPSERGGGPGPAPRPGQAPPLPAGRSAEGRAGAGGAARRRTPAGAMSSHRSESDWQGLVSEVRRREGAGPRQVRGGPRCGPQPGSDGDAGREVEPRRAERGGVRPLLYGVSPLSAASSVSWPALSLGSPALTPVRSLEGGVSNGDTAAVGLTAGRI